MAGQGLKRLLGRLQGRSAGSEPRSIEIGGRVVPYRLRRSPRRTFGLQVDTRGVTVAVPLRASEADVVRFVTAHAGWLLGKLDACAERLAPVRFEPADGALFPLLGEGCRLRLVEGRRGARWRTGPDGREELVLPAGLDGRMAMIRALKRRALPWFAERVAEYCHRLGQPLPPVRLTSARTRWGSCSTASGIRLHWRLIHLRPTLIDYVVAHEVAHLVEMNHSPRFWRVVDTLFPDWRAARAALREAARTLPVIDPAADGGPINED